MADCGNITECCAGEHQVKAACCKPSEEEMQRMFTEIDSDGDQLISKTELMELLARLNHKDVCPEKVAKIFDQVDEDNDEKINFEQFQQFLPTATEL